MDERCIECGDLPITEFALGAEGYIVVVKNENRRQRIIRWLLRRERPVDVYPVKVTQPVCPYCVQWYCTIHDVGDEMCGLEPECHFEPRWADGTVATITQQTPCPPCQMALDQMQRDRT